MSAGLTIPEESFVTTIDPRLLTHHPPKELTVYPAIHTATPQRDDPVCENTESLTTADTVAHPISPPNTSCPDGVQTVPYSSPLSKDVLATSSPSKDLWARLWIRALTTFRQWKMEEEGCTETAAESFKRAQAATRAWWAYGHDTYKRAAIASSANPRSDFQKAHQAILSRLVPRSALLTASMKAWLDVLGSVRDSGCYRAYRHRGVRKVLHVSRPDQRSKGYRIDSYSLATLHPEDRDMRSEVWRAFSGLSYQGRWDQVPPQGVIA